MAELVGYKNLIMDLVDFGSPRHEPRSSSTRELLNQTRTCCRLRIGNSKMITSN